MALRLTDRVDLATYYDIDVAEVGPAVRSTVTKEAFQAFYAGCPSVGFECDGRPIGGVIFDGESAHIAVHPSYHGRWGRLLEPMLAWLFGLRQVIIARLDKHNVKAVAFLERCGWPRVGEDSSEVSYRLTPRNQRANKGRLATPTERCSGSGG